MNYVYRLWCWLTRHQVGTRNWRAICSRCDKDFGSLSRYFE